MVDPRSFENPVTGQRFVVRRSGAETGGELFEAEMELGPRGFVIGEHVHKRQEERFTVLSGTVAFRISGEERIGHEGETFVAPPGTPHVWWNPGEEPARLLIEMRPALRFEEQMRTLYGLGRDGKTNDKGIPSLLQTAVFMREYRDELAPVAPPAFVQRLLFGLLAPIGRLAGLRPTYDRYAAPTAGVTRP